MAANQSAIALSVITIEGIAFGLAWRPDSEGTGSPERRSARRSPGRLLAAIVALGLLVAGGGARASAERTAEIASKRAAVSHSASEADARSAERPAARSAERPAERPAAHAAARPLRLLVDTSVPAPVVPRKVVSLDLCTDWMLARHADPAQVAALSPLHREHPVAWLDPARWPAHDGSLERIVALAPDLVVTGQYNATLLRGRLATLGFRVEVLALPTDPEGIVAYERRLLELLGRPPGLASVPPPPARPEARSRRMLLLGANGIGTGPGTFENAVLERAGWTNHLRDTGHLRLDLERIAVDPPDAILWTAPASRALANRFAEHPVLRRAVPGERWLATDYWRWQCPGPWTWELVGKLVGELVGKLRK